MKMSRWLSSVVLLSSSLVCVLCLRLYCDTDRSGKYDCNTYDCCSLICCEKLRIPRYAKNFGTAIRSAWQHISSQRWDGLWPPIHHTSQAWKSERWSDAIRISGPCINNVSS